MGLKQIIWQSIGYTAGATDETIPATWQTTDGIGQYTSAPYTVPAGKNLFVRNLWIPFYRASAIKLSHSAYGIDTEIYLIINDKSCRIHSASNMTSGLSTSFAEWISWVNINLNYNFILKGGDTIRVRVRMRSNNASYLVSIAANSVIEIPVLLSGFEA